MKIKLTQRGKFVISALLVIGVLAAVGFALYIVSWVSSINYDNVVNTPQINCVTDTVIQPDGSCAPVER